MSEPSLMFRPMPNHASVPACHYGGMPSYVEEPSMNNKIHDIGIARQIGTYSDAVEVPANARWLITAGTPGLDAEGKVPSDFGAQAELAWSHIVAMLERAG